MSYPIIQQTKIKNADRFSIKVNFAWLFAFSAFPLNDTVRSMFNEKFGWVNLLFLLSFITYYMIVMKNGNMRPLVSFILFTFSAVVLVNTFFMNKNTVYYIMTISNLLAPLLLLSIKISHKQALSALKVTLKVLNPLVLVVGILGVIDYATNSSIQLFLAQKFFDGTNMATLINQEISWGIYRYYSFIGHPLQTAKYFLIFFILNNIYGRYEKNLLSPLLVSVVTIMGLVISGSKTALLLGLFLIIFFSGLKKYKVLYYSLILVSLLFFFNTSLFQENLKMRFIQGFESGDITSGRNVLLDTWLHSDVEKPNFLTGGGADYSREISESLNGQIYNFEYPVIMLAYDYGILGMLVIYSTVFFFPIFNFIKRKKFRILLLFLVFAVMVNTNNGLANLGSDSLLSLCFIAFLLVNLEKDKQNSKKRKRYKIVW